MKQSNLQPHSNIQGLVAQQEAFFHANGLGTLLLRPTRRMVSPYAWIGHLPFARALIRLQRPRVLVELGTHIGNSFCGFCQAVMQEGLDTRCYAVDTWCGDANAGYYGESVYQDLASYVESSYGGFAQLLRMKFDQALEKFPDGSVDLLHIDGLHTYDAVKHDFESWRVKLSPRAVVLFHDTHVFDRGFGVNKFWSELREQYDGYEFLHSHGLGVLLVGAEVVPAVTEFIGLSNINPEPIQTVFELASQLGLNDEALRYQKRFGSNKAAEELPTTLYCELFFDYGQGFSEDIKLIAQLSLTHARGKELFELGQHAAGLVGVRFDPGVDAIALRKLKVQGRGRDGQWQSLEPISDAVIYREAGFALFPADPWLKYTVPADGIDAIEFDIEVEAMGIELVDQLIERMHRLSALEFELGEHHAEIKKLWADLTEKDRLLQADAELQAELRCELEALFAESRRLEDNQLYRLLAEVRLLPRLPTNSRNK